MKEQLEFYKKTSLFTDLGYYREFAAALPDDIQELCMLQRMQIIHPTAFYDESIRDNSHPIWGDIRNVPETRFKFEDELFPTAISMLSELLRKDGYYSKERNVEDKIYVTCRGQAILLTSILKAKGYSVRTRSGFAPYIKWDGVYYDHWIAEYYKEEEKRWVLVDADIHGFEENELDSNDIPRDMFMFGAEAYLKIREKTLEKRLVYYADTPPVLGLSAAVHGLFYDFHCLMNHEICFYHVPKYIRDKGFQLSEEEYRELDALATVMLEPDQNFHQLQSIWNSTPKYRILSGAMN